MIKYFEYKGEKLPLKLSHLTMIKYEEITGKSFAKFADGNIMVGDYKPLFFGCLVSGAKEEKTELKIKYEDLDDILEDHFQEISSIITTLNAKDKKK